MPLLVAILLAAAGAASAQTAAPRPGLSHQPTLYVVGYAHLDTQWNWDYAATIGEYLPDTMHKNFALFEKYPHYIFNFSGANRYRLMKEYYPADYARLKQYVAAGRWFPAGSSMEEGDVNSPSAESIIRQILYGKEYFRKDFGKTSAEYMLPDCFGFPASLPSILAHVGIKGFSTQKLSWGSAAAVGGPNSPEKTPLGTPFNVGMWTGPDGKSVIAAFNPTAYVSQVFTDLSSPVADGPANGRGPRRREQNWVKRVKLNGDLTGLYMDYRYYGAGDQGGAPAEDSVKMMEAIATQSVNPLEASAGVAGRGPLHVVPATAEQMFLDIPAAAARLPRYQGELELTNHSAGSITSEAYLKRWNRQNEVLADAAERASVAADWLQGRRYPLARLTDAWTLVMGGQFHDILPGTASPRAYEFSWNDEVLALNQFAGVVESASSAVVSAMDTQAKGVPVVVYNSLNVAREDVVEAAIAFPGGMPQAVRVTGPAGIAVPAQIANGKVLFVAKAPPVGYAVYDVQPAGEAAASSLQVNESTLENARYKVTVDERGDIASIFDKSLKRDLLIAPARLEIKNDFPSIWPAWNIDWEDQVRAPRAFAGGKPGARPAERPKVRIVENGAARVALEITRTAEGSTFVQTVRLAAGDGGGRVEIANAVDWNTRASHVKADFPLTAVNAMATYNWDIGAIERGTDNPARFEVPSHQWIDLTDQSGTFGATILTDCKNGSDKPDENTLRLTLLRTPGTKDSHVEQNTQDLGHHEFVYGIAGHAGDWRKGQTDWQAYRLNQPLVAFTAAAHAGALGKSFSLVTVSNSRIRVLALKKAEASDETIVRMVEMDGKAAPAVEVAFAGGIAAAREVNGAEEAVGSAVLRDGKLVTSFTAFQPRTFAVKLAPTAHKAAAVHSTAVKLEYDLAVASTDGATDAGVGFDGKGNTIPAEMLPAKLNYAGVEFALGEAKTGVKNAVTAKGQTIELPAGKFTSVYVLAASAEGDARGTFKVGESAADVTVQNWGGFIGQWDDRVWRTAEEPGSPKKLNRWAEMIGLTPGFIKRDPVAWYCSHHHTAAGTNEPYGYSYLFAYRLEVPAGAHTLTLPENGKIRVLAVSAVEEPALAAPAAPLYDTLSRK